jgi:hypothetical protein
MVGENADNLLFVMLSACSSVSTVPAGSLAKASLVGANTVNGPAPSSVSTNPGVCDIEVMFGGVSFFAALI